MKSYTAENLGIGVDTNSAEHRAKTIDYINMKLKFMGHPLVDSPFTEKSPAWVEFLELLNKRSAMLDKSLPPVDKRIQAFLDSYLSDTNEAVPQLPQQTFTLDKYSLAREMALPVNADEYHKDYVDSYRIEQGVLHNPKNDRRTTKGVFHVVEGGLPIPQDKKVVPKIAFQRLLNCALNNAPNDLLEIPLTSNQKKPVHTFVSLLLKPLVVPEVPNFIAEKRMEIRFFAPGNLISNLDFVESIFGNGGDPYLPKNDLALDAEHWTGNTGCVILAPHIMKMTKKELGLPRKKDATAQQIKDGMCWENEDELYNDGSPFKICARNKDGVVTIISDNYFGYSKKEVKTQIGYSANLFGLAEEEHAGGALAFPRYNLGNNFKMENNVSYNKHEHTFEYLSKTIKDKIIVQEEGYAKDKNYDNIFYIPENSEFDVIALTCTWQLKGKEHSLKIMPNQYFIYPSGYKVHLEQHPISQNWRLIGTVAEGTLIHKPCTVSGGGKSEISKSLTDAILYGSVFIGDFDKDMDSVKEIIDYDYSHRYISPPAKKTPRPLLSPQRSLGSVIKLLTRSEHFTKEYNEWLDSIPEYIKSLVFVVKKFYQPKWGNEWRDKFSVDIINGKAGNEVKFNHKKLLSYYLRVGTQQDGTWTIYRLRQEFIPAEKIQWEDDISASVTVPTKALEGLNPDYKNASFKFTENCEYRFFQRPDDAKIRGYDKQAEIDLSSKGSFISNFEPQTQSNAQEFLANPLEFDLWTQPVQKMITDFAQSEDKFFISPAHSRIYDGSPTKNPRYLQVRPDLLDYEPSYIAEVGVRLFRGVTPTKPVYHPVNAIISGRRNNPAEPGIQPLAVYNPLHYQNLPELFMDYIPSVTGKSPSTTGAGVEGALTKGPFNCLVAITDLNNALLTAILGQYSGFTTSAGNIGREHKVEHDISLLIPEVWARLTEEERDPKTMIEKGYLQKIDDFDHNGETILGSRLGYRITVEFLNDYFGRVFQSPHVVFPKTMLAPEIQSMDEYVDGIKNICDAQTKVAKTYLEAGYDEHAIPPLKALFHIMVSGNYQGKTVDSPEVQKLFDYDTVIKSDWYKARLGLRQKNEMELLNKQISYIKEVMTGAKLDEVETGINLKARLSYAEKKLKEISAPEYIETLTGSIGLDPLNA